MLYHCHCHLCCCAEIKGNCDLTRQENITDVILLLPTQCTERSPLVSQLPWDIIRACHDPLWSFLLPEVRRQRYHQHLQVLRHQTFTLALAQCQCQVRFHYITLTSQLGG